MYNVHIFKLSVQIKIYVVCTYLPTVISILFSDIYNSALLDFCRR